MYHYAPAVHALEIRAQIPQPVWEKLCAGFPEQTVFIGLSSIYWREAWKYGLRAYRYCHHDLGHALGAIGLACAGLGWNAALLDALDGKTLESLLGLTEKSATEVEVPDCLLAVSPESIADPSVIDASGIVEDFNNLEWLGTPNTLSPSHVEWSAIGAVSQAAMKPAAVESPAARPTSNSASLITQDGFPLRKAIHQRRSAVAMDGRTRIARDTFLQFMIKTVPALCPLPFQALPLQPQVHLGLFVHRVDDLPEGLYCLVRNQTHVQELRSSCKPDFLWEKPPGCPEELDLYFLKQGDFRNRAASVSCGQAIAADGCFSLGMLCAFSETLKRHGPWFYPRLYWECGAIGQTLYLQAEVSGIRSTGIGCFFDDPVHEIFGIGDDRYQSLYHFTVGGPVEDTRLTTLPPY